MKRLWLHIGLEKTGSTSFQAFCAENREALKAAGIVYPINAACFLDINHAPLAASYFTADEASALLIAGRRAGRAEAVAALKAEAEEATLVSAEHFSSRFDPGRIAQLADDLSGFSVCIVVVVRHPLARAASAYATTIASGRGLTLDAFVDELCQPGNAYLRFRHTIEEWSNVFARQQMIVVPYREGEDIVAALMQRLAPAVQPRLYRRNVSPSAQQTEWRRRANEGRWPAFARPFGWLLGRAAKGGPPKLTLGQTQRIESLLQKDIAWLQQEYGVTL